jgi:2-furoyl-CoA dehydrogenase large subunit
VTARIEGVVTVHGTPEAIWAILDDPDALGRVLPGCESIARGAADRFRAVLASKTRFMTVRTDVEATYRETDPPRHLRLDLAGRPRGIGGTFLASIPFDLARLEDGRTEVRYAIELTLGGALSGFGGRLVGEALASQIDELVRNVERELASR